MACRDVEVAGGSIKRGEIVVIYLAAPAAIAVRIRTALIEGAFNADGILRSQLFPLRHQGRLATPKAGRD